MEEQPRNPWDQQPNETGKAYAAFLVYRDLGHARTSAEVGRQLGKSAELIRRWRKQWRWDDRVAEWDSHLAGARDMAWLEATVATPSALAAMNQRHLACLQQLQQKALLRLEQLQSADLPLPLAFQWFMEALRAERAVYVQLPEEAKGEEADQDAVVAILADPESRALAARLAAKVGHAEMGEKTA